MGVPKTSDNIKIEIHMQIPSQEPPASSKSQNKDLKDMEVLCTFKLKIENQNSEQGHQKDKVSIFKSRSRCQKPVKNIQHPTKLKIQT